MSSGRRPYRAANEVETVGELRDLLATLAARHGDDAPVRLPHGFDGDKRPNVRVYDTDDGGVEVRL